VVPGTVTTHEVPLAEALHIRERNEVRVVVEPEELMEESNIVLLRDILRGAWRIAADCRPRAAHLAPHRRGRGERESRVLASLRVVALRHIATQVRGLVNHGHRLGVMKHVHVTHTVRRRMLERPRMPQPVFHDAMSDLKL
jgi:hypothetical protein